MFKWVLVSIGIFVAIIAVFVGVVVFLFGREGVDTSGLTELQSAEVLELVDVGSSYRVVYEYSVEGQTFYGRTTIYADSMESGSTFGICVNPDDPAQHAETYTDCSAGEPGTLMEGSAEKPEL